MKSEKLIQLKGLALKEYSKLPYPTMGLQFDLLFEIPISDTTFRFKWNRKYVELTLLSIRDPDRTLKTLNMQFSKHAGLIKDRYGRISRTRIIFEMEVKPELLERQILPPDIEKLREDAIMCLNYFIDFYRSISKEFHIERIARSDFYQSFFFFHRRDGVTKKFPVWGGKGVHPSYIGRKEPNIYLIEEINQRLQIHKQPEAWELLLANSLNNFDKRDKRIAVIEACTAFEIFLNNFLIKELINKKRLNLRNANKLLNRKWRVGERLSSVYKDIYGLKFKQESPDAYKNLFGDKKISAFKIRNKTIHAGYTPTEKEALKSVNSVLKAIELISKKSPQDLLDKFVQMICKEEFDNAKIIAEKIEASTHNSAYCFEKLGVFYFFINEIDKAESILKQTLAKDDKLARTWYFLARILNIKKSKYKRIDAQKAIEKSLFLDSLYVPAWIFLGNLFMKKGEFDEAKEAYQIALDINPHHWESRLALGELYMHKNPLKAKHWFNKTLEIKPDCLEAIRNLISILKNEDKPKTKKLCTKALSLDPSAIDIKKILQSL